MFKSAFYKTWKSQCFFAITYFSNLTINVVKKKNLLISIWKSQLGSTTIVVSTTACEIRLSERNRAKSAFLSPIARNTCNGTSLCVITLPASSHNLNQRRPLVVALIDCLRRIFNDRIIHRSSNSPDPLYNTKSTWQLEILRMICFFWFSNSCYQRN